VTSCLTGDAFMVRLPGLSNRVDAQVREVEQTGVVVIDTPLGRLRAADHTTETRPGDM
jgi:hypothetical protein